MAIWKSKDPSATNSPLQSAGDKQERDVAFYLRRAFKDNNDYIIINDYSFNYNDEKAQIDHLVIHRFGFLIIESKSIYGEVKVNDQGEWSRSYKGQWAGIPSPIKQSELQLQLLKLMLRDNVEQFLGKLLGLQQGVGKRKWNSLCAVSNSCILHRNNIPANINNRVIKSEAVEQAVRSIGDGSLLKVVMGTDPRFSIEEMENIANFLLGQSEPEVVKAATEPTISELQIQSVQKNDDTPSNIVCKKCGEATRLTGMYGKYGYYVKCLACQTNTSMKRACIKCNQPLIKINKKRNEYWANCNCSDPYILFVDPSN